MASIKVVLRTNYQKEDGSCPIALRITRDRKSRYIYTGKYVHEKHWDKSNCKVKKSHPNSTRLNNYLLKKLSEANDSVLELTTANNQVTTKQLKNKIKPTNKTVSFFDLAARRIKRIPSKRDLFCGQCRAIHCQQPQKVCQPKESFLSGYHSSFYSEV